MRKIRQIVSDSKSIRQGSEKMFLQRKKIKPQTVKTLFRKEKILF